jgi:hypothetical protein
LDLTASQVYDNSTENTFVFNHYSEWVTPDVENDGYVDLPYLINGSAQNQDPYPLVHPNPPLTHRIFGIEVLYPNGGEKIGGIVRVEWTQPIDSLDYPIEYSLKFSENGGDDWEEPFYMSLLQITFYYWDTLECYDGSVYLIKVVAHTSDGVSEEDISDSTFSVINGINKPLPPQSPPPLALRILLFVVFCTILAGLIKRGYSRTS